MAENYDNLQFSYEKKFQELINQLKKLVQEAQKKGVNIFKREDCLTCMECEAYEEIGPDAKRYVFDDQKKLTDYGEFIIIDSNYENVIESESEVDGLRSYEFICPVCGLMQIETLEYFYEDSE